MHSLVVGTDYCLRLPDGRSLGRVHVARLVGPWAEGPFSPTPEFEEFREIFEGESRLRHDQVVPLWEEAGDTIEALGIQVVKEGAGPVLPRMRIFVEGKEAILGVPLAP
jgi:hypothetical protein